MRLGFTIAIFLALAACTPSMVSTPPPAKVMSPQPVAKPVPPLRRAATAKPQGAEAKTLPASEAPSENPKAASALLVTDAPIYTGGGRSEKKVTVELY